MGKRLQLSSALRGRKALWTFGGVAGLAAVIFVASSLSAPNSPPDAKPSEFTPELRAEELAQEASKAASAFETRTASDLANRALALDADNQTAKRVIDTLSSTPQTGAAEGSSSGTSTATPSKYLKATKDMAGFLPDMVAGWSTLDVVEQSRDALVTFEPTKAATEYRSVARVSVSVHDRGSPKAAQTFVKKVSMRVYSKNSGSADLGAVAAYTGTDGVRLATVAFARGRYAFEVIVSGHPGVKPSSVVATGVKIARLVPGATEE